MRNSSVIGRTAAIAAVAIAVLAVAVIVLSGGSDYTVKAVFQNASQVVSGDQVQVAGNPIGTVSDISLTPDGQAQLTLDITDHTFNPLRVGTVASVRETSLSGIANRYVDLQLGPGNAPAIHNGASIGTRYTNSEVDLDELFNTLDKPTRRALQQVIQGSASAYAGSGTLAQKGWQYLNPAIASSSVLFGELNRNSDELTNFLVKTGNLVTTIAQRHSDLSSLIRNLATTTGALANQQVALGQAVQRLPGFMRLANTTFVNLRSALDDLKPLVDVSKPVAPKLQTLLEQLKPLADNAVPTVRDLSAIVSRPGANNDLTELVKLGVPLANVTVHDLQVNGKLRPGAFNASTQALNGSTPELAFARPYAVDLTGWFEGFSHPGSIDANGAKSRVAPTIPLAGLSAFSPVRGGAPALTGQGDRCPGSMERNSVWFPEPGYQCNPSEVPVGP